MKKYELTLQTGDTIITQEMVAVNEQAARTKMIIQLGYYNTDVPYTFTDSKELTNA